MPSVFMCASGVSTMVRARASKAAVLGWAGASDCCQCLGLAVASNACDPRCERCLAGQDRSHPPPLTPAMKPRPFLEA